ncbi:unnamed protein product [Strongylus vulgaris]|uniref:G-protein coupled receptors family 1 profile domain-containing protein n=1 Tax=Strongylus vulgaris TaxID=40348 RepID=A0A3P7L2X9_STRVU|nr:unnamed protein product [Strongylus vulgaris]
MSAALECFRSLHNFTQDELTTGRIIYGVLLASIATVSAPLNMLLLIVILTTGAIKNPFRFYLLSATSAGLLGLVPVYATLLPAVFFNVRLKDPTNIIVSTTDTLSYLALMMTTTTIATDRLLFFLLPKVCMSKRCIQI